MDNNKSCSAEGCAAARPMLRLFTERNTADGYNAQLCTHDIVNNAKAQIKCKG